MSFLPFITERTTCHRLLDVRVPETRLNEPLSGAEPLNLSDVAHLPAQQATLADVPLDPPIGPTDTIVVTDDAMGQAAARTAWTLLHLGARHVTLLDPDGTHDGARPAADENPVRADGDWAQAHLHDPDVVFLDVRGELERNAGTLPGAVAWNWTGGLNGAGGFNASHAARDDLMRAGVRQDATVVTYCQSGLRAAHTFWLLRALGWRDVRLYEGSWADWQERQP